MPKRSPQLLLEDIIESANKILAYTEGLSFEQFLADGTTVDAVSRKVNKYWHPTVLQTKKPPFGGFCVEFLRDSERITFAALSRGSVIRLFGFEEAG